MPSWPDTSEPLLRSFSDLSQEERAKVLERTARSHLYTIGDKEIRRLSKIVGNEPEEIAGHKMLVTTVLHEPAWMVAPELRQTLESLARLRIHEAKADVLMAAARPLPFVLFQFLILCAVGVQLALSFVGQDSSGVIVGLLTLAVLLLGIFAYRLGTRRESAVEKDEMEREARFELLISERMRHNQSRNA